MENLSYKSIGEQNQIFQEFVWQMVIELLLQIGGKQNRLEIDNFFLQTVLLL